MWLSKASPAASRNTNLDMRSNICKSVKVGKVDTLLKWCPLLQEMDFAGTLFVVTPERLASLDFSEPLYIDEYNSIYVRPGVIPDMASFIKPYNPLVSDGTWVVSLHY